MLDHLHTIAAALDDQFAIHALGEVPIEVLHGPWQSLRLAAQELGRRTRTEAAQGSRLECKDLYEIDRGATLLHHGDLNPDQHNLLRHFMQGAAWSKLKFIRTGYNVEDDFGNTII